MPLVTLPGWLARFNRVATNPVQGLWAWRLPPWAVVVHVGRRTGATYRTPVLAWRLESGDGIAIVLTYGDRVQWVRNLLAAGGGHLVRAGRVERLVDLRVMDAADVPGMGGAVRSAGRQVGGRALVARLEPPGPDAPPARRP